ncbi:MAG: hypothetical protein ABWY45_18590, partial [Mycobacterium sp.]
SRTDPGGRARAEFVGDGRRTVEIPVAQWGSLVFVNVTMSAPVPLSIAGNRPPDGLAPVVMGSQLVSGNWLSTPQRSAAMLVEALGRADVQVTDVAPNLVMVQCGTDMFAAVSRPAGHTRSTLVWALLRPPTGIPAIDAVRLAEMVSRCGPSHGGLNEEETATVPR